MHCETYNATIPEKTCVSRCTELAIWKPSSDMTLGTMHLYHRFGGCLKCDKGKDLIERIKKGEILLETKQCTKCKEDKPLSDFYNHKTGPKGKSYWCKICSNKASRDSVKKQPSKPAAQSSPNPKSSKDVGKQENVPKTDKTPTDHQPDPAVDENILILDFSKHQDLLNGIRMAAKSELRDPDMQVFWWLYQREEFETA